MDRRKHDGVMDETVKRSQNGFTRTPLCKMHNYEQQIFRDTHMQFLAAKSRWISFLLAKYSIPLVICKHMSIRFVDAPI